MDLLKGILGASACDHRSDRFGESVTIAVLAFWNTTMDAVKYPATPTASPYSFAVGLFIAAQMEADPIYVMVGSGVAGLGTPVGTYLL